MPTYFPENNTPQTGDSDNRLLHKVAGALDGTTPGTGLRVSPANVTTPFRETFESWPSPEWSETKAPSDVVTVDGNALGASYLAISLSPLTAGTETFVDTVDTFTMPFDLAVGLHMSQNTWGQDCSVEFLDVDEIPAVADMEIASISQATTVLTVDTVLPHNLVPGKRIGIRGCSNAVVNYPSVVVAQINSPTQFTVTGGPNSTIPTQTVTNPAGAKGFVYFRPALSSRRNGTSLHLESSTATLGFMYARAAAGDALPFASGSGNALNGRQATTVGTTASVPLVASAPYTYTFTPTNEYRLTLMEDRLQWSDALVDSIAASNPRVTRTQVVPNPAKRYRVRLKARNEPSLTVPSAQIVSVSKAGSTTATVTTASAHGLVTGDLILGYGVRDVAATFYPALTTPAAVTVLTPTTFTVVWGTSGTTTSYGGYIAKVNAACPVPGAASPSIQSAVKTTLADGQHQIVLVGSATLAAAVVIGDEVEIFGCRDAVNGLTSIGIDGVWKVANVVTTTLTLVNIPGFSPTVPDFSLVNCGGGIIKRTTMRVSYLRPTQFERQRVEMLPRPLGDIAAAIAVAVQNTVAATISSGTLTTLTSMTSGNLGIPGTIADVASAALTSSATVAAITPTFGTSYEVCIPVTAVTGTNPTLDVGIEESDDSGTNWFRVFDFPRITATGTYRSPKLPLTGNRVRYVQTVGGTTPSFTRAVNRLQSSDRADPVRQSIDRTVVLTTSGSATPSLNIQNCRNAQLVVNIGAATTPPALQLEGSDDNGATWYALGSPLTAVASSTVQTTVANVQAQLLRARVSTAGATVTMGSVTLKGF